MTICYNEKPTSISDKDKASLKLKADLYNKAMSGHVPSLIRIWELLYSDQTDPPTAFCPCDYCNNSTACLDECNYFRAYVSTESSRKRQAYLMRFQKAQNNPPFK